MTLAAGSCFLAPIAAKTPAGPPPITTILRASLIGRLPLAFLWRHTAFDMVCPQRGRAAWRPDGYQAGQGEGRRASPAVLGGDRDRAAQGLFRGRGRARDLDA